MGKTFKFYKKYIGWIILLFGLLFIQAFSDLSLPDYMSRIVSEGIAQSDIGLVIRFGLIMLGYSFGVTACSIAVGYLAAHIGTSASRDMRKALFEKVSNFSAAEYDKFTVSSLITRSTNDITQIQMFAIMCLRMVLYAPIIAIGGVLKAVEKSSGMNYLVIVIVVAVAIVLITIGILLIIVQPKFMKLQKLMDKLNLVAREGLNGMMAVRAFGSEKREEARFEQVNSELTRSNLFVNRVMSILMPVIMVVMNGVSVAVLWIASYSATDIVQIGNMMAFIQYAIQIIMAFMMVTMVFVLMPRAVVSARRVGEVLSVIPGIPEKQDAIKAENINGVITFENVCFKYEGSDENVLENISFTAKPNTTTAIIGSTGCGKSTLISLIPRLYDVTEGAVKIDGTDIRDFTLESLREVVGFVPQRNVLFSGTIGSNIRYANPEVLTDEDAIAAAEIAQASEIIAEKDEGLDSKITQNGSNVSGGQRQRIAIARMVAKKAPIAIFDDSFSALDFKTDAKLRTAIKEKMKDTTVLIVAQRVGTIMSADKILVLDEGKIVGEGTHAELMKNCSVYSDIAHSQLSEKELA